MTGQWSREALEALIIKWQDFPCLYDVKTKIYFNKNARHRAFNDIAAAVSEWRPCTTGIACKLKMQNLRTQFVAENKKVRTSLKSGCSPDDVYVPGLWFYSKLKFLDSHIQPRPSTSLGSLGRITPQVCNTTGGEIDSESEDEMVNHSQSSTLVYEGMAEHEEEEFASCGALMVTVSGGESPNSSLWIENPAEADGPSSASTNKGPGEPLSLSGGRKRKLSKSKEQEVSKGASIKERALTSIAEAVNNPAIQQERLLCQFLVDGWSRIRSPTTKKELRRRWILSLLEAEADDDKENSF